MIRLVAVDMDGTLLRSDGRISEGNAATIRQLQKEGIEFLICTGRSYKDAMVPLKEQQITAPAVCMNGAGIYNGEGELIVKNPLSIRQVAEILNCCKGEQIFVELVTDKGSYTIMSPEDLRRSLELCPNLAVARIPFEILAKRFVFVKPEEVLNLGLEFYKISLIHPSPEVLARMKEKLEKISDLVIAASSTSDLELTHVQAQKGTALASYAAMKGIGLNETMAIGDSENDHSMLSMDLKYTLAMGNAMDSIKRVARCQTRTNDEDGVSYAIETLVLSPQARAC